MRTILLLVCVLLGVFKQLHGLAYTLVFSDEFNTDNYINGSKWNVIDRPSEVNDELQWYSWEDVYAKGGNMVLQSRKHYVSGWGTSRQYSSGRIDTQNKFELLYGEVEWRAKLPAGQGIWPALWLVQWQCPPATPCSTWPPGIDVMVSRGDLPNQITTCLHYGRYPIIGSSGTAIQGADFTAGFHVFKVLWDPNQIVWYVDGKEVYRISDKNIISNEKMYLIMNVAVGGFYPGSPDATTPFPTEMLIDYVRVYRWQ